MKKYLFLPVLFFLLALGITSCRQVDIYEKNIPIPGYKWKSSFVVKGSFQVSDTLTPYNIYLVLRHTDAYRYNNIWLNIGVQAPGDTMHYEKKDLQLATDATGWKGTGMNDIWEVRERLNDVPRRFPKVGTYQLSIRQIMRDDPLPEIMSAGLRVQKQ